MEPGEYVRLPLSKIRRPDDPHRRSMDLDALQELADDMAVNGLHQPIGVRGPFPDGTYEVVFGDRRTAAANMNHWDLIDARLFAVAYDPLLARASENFHREGLSPVEEADIVARFLARKQPVAAITRELRRSRSWVEQRMALLDYPEDIRAAVHDGSLSLALAHLLAQIDHDPYRAELVAEAARVGANSATATVWLAHFQRDRDMIVKNQQTVQEILTARDEYRIIVSCDGCQQETDIAATRLLRFCAHCVAAIDAERQQATATP